MIYLDNAATSWPKPPGVAEAMAGALTRAGGNPGRAGHRLSLASGHIMYDVREALAAFFGASDPLGVIFTQNATHALNLALHGLLRPGARVVCTSMEHNGLMRPLRALERAGVEVVVVPCGPDGLLPVDALAAAATPGTAVVVINHASNVTGTIAPVAEAGEVARRAGALLLVDAAQSAGVLPIDMGRMGIDLLAFAGHKGLLGPSGTGGLLLGASVDAGRLDSLIQGGTGSRSEQEVQPEDLPDKFESGTSNFVGIAGLGAGLRFVQERGVAAIRAHEMALAERLRDGLLAIGGAHGRGCCGDGPVAGGVRSGVVTVYGPVDPARRVGVVSFTVDGLSVSDVGFALDDEFGVLTRVGLHCAPAAHRTIGTLPGGTVRLAPGPFTTPAEVDKALEAIAAVIRRLR
ncbi:MAG TPA: aminotransferase class V-fold PLP-dependent enzyme [Symbiobacteriaceae bacterium]|nr:aminotransferase class V-fold PLP-dependent enzyme [Symbiobacteriaceae bacterium]